MNEQQSPQVEPDGQITIIGYHVYRATPRQIWRHFRFGFFAEWDYGGNLLDGLRLGFSLAVNVLRHGVWIAERKPLKDDDAVSVITRDGEIVFKDDHAETD